MAVVIAVAVPAGTHADENPHDALSGIRTLGLLNCKGWKSININERVGYVFGFTDGLSMGEDDTARYRASVPMKLQFGEIANRVSYECAQPNTAKTLAVATVLEKIARDMNTPREP